MIVHILNSCKGYATIKQLMKILFISRKKSTDFGGLARFSNELHNRFTGSYLLTVTNLPSFLKIPYQKIDLIHLCDLSLLPIGVILKTLLHKPLTATAHGLDLVYPNFFYQKILKYFSPKIHALVADSPGLKNNLKNLPLKIKKEVVINPGITINHFNKIAPIELPLDIRKKIVLLTVGNLVKRKGQAWFIKNVMGKLGKNFVYFIVGDGPERIKLMSLISQMGLTNQICLIGQISHQQLAWLYQRTDVYVCPNQKIAHDFEGFGIAAGEAAALGIPVVASQVDGLPSIIHDQKNGLVVPPTAGQFIKAIKQIQHIKFDKNYTKRNFDWEKTVRQYQKVFKEVIDKNLKSRGQSFPN